MKMKLAGLVTGILLLVSPWPALAADGDEAAIREILAGWALAWVEKDPEGMAGLVVATDAFTIIEGGHINLGWADFRDNHLLPELEMFTEMEYRVEDARITVTGDTAYALFQYHLSGATKERSFGPRSGRGTAVLERTADGWKIRHIQTS